MALTKGVQLKTSSISKLFIESPLLKDQKTWFENEFFIYVARSIYGVSPEQIDRITKESVFQAITERFELLTINDIQIAFRTHVQEEKTYNLTRDEFIKPIENYWNKKLIVKLEVENEIRRIKNIENEKIIADEKYKEARQLYLDSIGKGIYIGDMFHASMIMENFKDLLKPKEKIRLLEIANHKYMDAMSEKSEWNIVPSGFGTYKNGKPKPKCHYFLAVEVINHFLNLKTAQGIGYNFVEI